MGEFFNGWRRKTACLTLLVALLFTGGWIRGGLVADFIRIATGDDGAFNLMSRRGNVVLSFEQFPRSSGPTTSSYVAIKPDNAEQWYSLEGATPRVRIQGCGVCCCKYDEVVPSSPAGEPFIIHTTALMISYWLLALPAVLISAWILLSKQPPAKVQVQP